MRISSPSRVAMSSSLAFRYRCRSTGCAERASGVEASKAWPTPDPAAAAGNATVFGIPNPSLLRVYRQRRTAARMLGLLTDL